MIERNASYFFKYILTIPFRYLINFIRLKKYPFLECKPLFNKDKYTWKDKYKYTYFDDIPRGWRKAFGKQMVKEISAVLKKYNYEKEYTVLQVKEKYGGLRWYDSGAPEGCYDELREVINKYEDLSYTTCIECGKPGTIMSKGWICPYCDDCKEKFEITQYEEIEK